MGTEERVVNSGRSLNWAWRKKSFLEIEDEKTSLWCFIFVLLIRGLEDQSGFYLLRHIFCEIYVLINMSYIHEIYVLINICLI